MKTFITKFATIPQKKQVVKIRKINEADCDSDGEENHTFHISISLVVCMSIIISYMYSKEICIFVLMFLVCRSELSMQKHVAAHRWLFDS